MTQQRPRLLWWQDMASKVVVTGNMVAGSLPWQQLPRRWRLPRVGFSHVGVGRMLVSVSAVVVTLVVAAAAVVARGRRRFGGTSGVPSWQCSRQRQRWWPWHLQLHR